MTYIQPLEHINWNDQHKSKSPYKWDVRAYPWTKICHHSVGRKPNHGSYSISYVAVKDFVASIHAATAPHPPADPAASVAASVCSFLRVRWQLIHHMSEWMVGALSSASVWLRLLLFRFMFSHHSANRAVPGCCEALCLSLYILRLGKSMLQENMGCQWFPSFISCTRWYGMSPFWSTTTQHVPTAIHLETGVQHFFGNRMKHLYLPDVCTLHVPNITVSDAN